MLDVSCDASSLSATLKKIDGRLIRIEPDSYDSNGNITICSYKATIQTSPTEEYSLILPCDCLLQCINTPTDYSNIIEVMLSDLVEKQELILSYIRCTFDTDSGVIKQMKRQHSVVQNRKNIFSFFLNLKVLTLSFEYICT